MVTKQLKETVNGIEMPDDMRTRIIENCYLARGEKRMRKDKEKAFFGKPAAAAAAVALCICLTGVTVAAATGKLQGFFKDIIRWDGAIVGTSYEQATDELKVSAAATSEGLKIEVIFLIPDQAPYLYFEQFGIQACEIVDSDGKVMGKEITLEPAEVQDGKVNLLLSSEELPKGSYTLRISEMIGTKKADQPLVLHGVWECEFVW